MAALRFVPWWSLLVVALLTVGIVGFALYGNKVADQSEQLYSLVGGADTGFQTYMGVYKTCWPVTLGVAGGAMFASMLMAATRTNQKLRRAGRSKKTGARGVGEGEGCCWGSAGGMR